MGLRGLVAVSAAEEVDSTVTLNQPLIPLNFQAVAEALKAGVTALGGARSYRRTRPGDAWRALAASGGPVVSSSWCSVSFLRPFRRVRCGYWKDTRPGSIFTPSMRRHPDDPPGSGISLRICGEPPKGGRCASSLVSSWRRKKSNPEMKGGLPPFSTLWSNYNEPPTHS